jgi:hypothetical protein
MNEIILFKIYSNYFKVDHRKPVNNQQKQKINYTLISALTNLRSNSSKLNTKVRN